MPGPTALTTLATVRQHTNTSPEPDEDTADRLGTLLGGRYRIERFVAKGGMGAVFSGRHVVLQTDIAIKIVHIDDRYSTEARFLREARLACSVRHPNLVQIMDCGLLSDGRGYLVMEFLRGQTLASSLSAGPMDALRTCQIGAQIARGLTAIHDRGIVHCDMKPRNVLLVRQDDAADCVKIIDFGIAKSFSTQDPEEESLSSRHDSESRHKKSGPRTTTVTQSATGFVAGTPHYMSPEQCQGRRLDGRSDMYSLGCMLYEMLTGSVPFQGSDVTQILDAHLTAPVPSIRSHGPLNASEALEGLIYRMLAKDPALRLGSMHEVERLLRQEEELLLLQRGERVLWEREHLQWLVHRHRHSRRPRLARSPLLRQMVAVLIAAMGVRLGYHVRPVRPPAAALPRPPVIEGTMQPVVPASASGQPLVRCSEAAAAAAGSAAALSACSDWRRSDAVPASASLDGAIAPPPAPLSR